MQVLVMYAVEENGTDLQIVMVARINGVPTVSPIVLLEGAAVWSNGNPYSIYGKAVAEFTGCHHCNTTISVYGCTSGNLDGWSAESSESPESPDNQKNTAFFRYRGAADADLMLRSGQVVTVLRFVADKGSKGWHIRFSDGHECFVYARELELIDCEQINWRDEFAGREVRFTPRDQIHYPRYYDEDLSSRSGQVAILVRPSGIDEGKSNPANRIRFDDGFEYDVFDDELSMAIDT